VTDVVETRSFSIPYKNGKKKNYDFELDLRTTDKTHIDIRKRNLRRMGYHVRIITKPDEFLHGSSMIHVIVYSLYKREKSTERKYYPLSTKLLSKSIGESLS